jgi:hypothetical protein
MAIDPVWSNGTRPRAAGIGRCSEQRQGATRQQPLPLTASLQKLSSIDHIIGDPGVHVT